MKRRDFIINSALLIGIAPFLSGCGKNELITKDGQILKRKFHDLEIPLLGFDCISLPMISKKLVDTTELDKIVDYAVQHGANYFDTAYIDVESDFENAIGKSLSRYSRKDFILADKIPVDKINTPEDVKMIFEEQCMKCKVKYFDFYMCHNINKNTIERFKALNIYDELVKLKNAGRIKYLGFSFNGAPEILKELVNEYKWDFCQLAINYFDWNLVKAQDQYEIVQDAGIPVIAVEPLKEGMLVNLSEKTMNELESEYPDTTPAEFGLRWAASEKNIITVLSGMNNLQQVKDNVEIFMHYEAMTEDDKKVAEHIAKVIQSQGEINCTGCKDCMGVCPMNIDIPAIFAINNQYKMNGDKIMYLKAYDTLADSEKPDKCIKCGLCTRNCPQNLKIPELLSKVANDYNKVKGENVQ